MFSAVASVMSDSATSWTIAPQAPLSMGLSGQEYLSELPWLPPGDLPDPGAKPMSLMPPALTGKFFTTDPPGKLPYFMFRRGETLLGNGVIRQLQHSAPKGGDAAIDL